MTQLDTFPVAWPETRRGLPNTCCVCGTPCEEIWYAEHDDAALSGQGRCASCVPRHMPQGVQSVTVLDLRDGVDDEEATAASHALRERQEQGAYVTDAALNLAAELGVDLTTVQGTGDRGRIIVRDVRRAAREG